MRRRLNIEAGEGSSTQPEPSVVPRGVVPGPRGSVDAPATIVTTPRRHPGVLRGIRKRMGGMRDKEINDYLMHLDREDRDISVGGGVWSSSDEDISADDSEDEYRPPGDRERERRKVN